jgi:hypothetical protein
MISAGIISVLTTNYKFLIGFMLLWCVSVQQCQSCSTVSSTVILGTLGHCPLYFYGHAVPQCDRVIQRSDAS